MHIVTICDYYVCHVIAAEHQLDYFSCGESEVDTSVVIVFVEAVLHKN